MVERICPQVQCSQLLLFYLSLYPLQSPAVTQSDAACSKLFAEALIEWQGVRMNCSALMWKVTCLNEKSWHELNEAYYLTTQLLHKALHVWALRF